MPSCLQYPLKKKGAILFLRFFQEFALVSCSRSFSVSQLILNLIQLLVIVDVIYLDLGIAQYFVGVALGSLIMDIFIFYQIVGIKNYSIQYFIRFITAGIVTFLLVLFVTIFTLVWAHIGAAGSLFKDQLVPILMLISTVYTLSAAFYNRKIYHHLHEKPLNERNP